VDVMNMFEELHKEGITMILVTHSADVAKCAKRTIQIRDGEIIKGIFGEEEKVL
jgi:putative ABC transport system ATP-binding protein